MRNIIAQRFGRLTAIKSVGRNPQGSLVWLCTCECGNTKKVSSGKLCSGATRSCGCLKSELTIARNFKHGLAKTAEWIIWSHIRARCNDHGHPYFKDYGGRGIKVSHMWDEFPAFLRDMGHRPTPKHTIERKNNDREYSPSNCCWATRKQQARNTRTNRFVNMRGEKKCVAEWAEILNVNLTTVWARIYKGWSEVDALTTPTIRGKHMRRAA